MKPKAKWPELPKPPPDMEYHGYTCIDSVTEPPMFDRKPTGASSNMWDTPKVYPSVCKHGEGSCEECGTTNRRDAVHTTLAGKGAVARLRSR